MRRRDPSLAEAARRLSAARRVCVLTGAGVSAESGIPTFRDALTGLWARFRPEELATPEAFARDPELIWQWYEWRRALLHEAQPNPAHYALAEMARLSPGLTLITQNVDGLHQRAGSEPVIEYHGNILRDRCTAEGVVATRRAQDSGQLPRCATCAALLRPDVVWFGEPIPREALRAADAAAAGCDVFVAVGTSSLVYPAAGLAETAQRAGAAIIEVNPSETDLSANADLTLRGLAGVLLPELVQVIAELRAPSGIH